jgi:hypothetical protein
MIDKGNVDRAAICLSNADKIGIQNTSTLRSKLESKRAQIEKDEIEKRTNILMEKHINKLESTIENRKYYARSLEKKLLLEGFDIYVSVYGDYSDILLLKYVLMSRPLVYQLMSDTKLEHDIREQGFSKIYFDDENGNRWAWSVDGTITELK